MKKNIKNNLLFILIIIQPILDVIAYFALNTKYFIIAFSIRSLILAISTIYVLKNNFSKKYLIILLLIAFLGCGHLITSYLYSNINLFEDLKELIRIIYMPLLAINGYYYVKNHPDTLPQVKKGIICNVFIIFAIIILSIITKHSVPTYAEGYGLRGWFYNSNSQSLILSFAVPFAFYYCFQTKKIWLKILLILISFFLLFSNGTTGCYIMIIPTFALPMLHTLYSKEKLNYKIFEIVICLIPIICCLSLYKYSPDYKISNLSNQSLNSAQHNFSDLMTQENPNNSTNPDNPTNPTTPDNPEEPNLSNDELVIKHYFEPKFVADYGYDEIKKAIGSDNFNVENLVNNRFRKKTVAKVIYENSNIASKLFGFEFSKIDQYGSDMENDYTSIFYYSGYIGFTLYISLILYVVITLLIKFLKNPKLFFDSEFIMIAFLFLVLNVGAEYSGSLLRRPNASIYMALMIIYILGKYKEVKHEQKHN